MNTTPRATGLCARGAMLVTAAVSMSLVLTSTPGHAAVGQSDSTSASAVSSGSATSALVRRASVDQNWITTLEPVNSTTDIVGNTGTLTTSKFIDSTGRGICQYTLRDGTSFPTSIGTNQAAFQNYLDTLAPKHSNVVTDVDVRDGDGDVGGNVIWNSPGFAIDAGSNYSCPNALDAVMDQGANSRGRVAASNFTQVAVLIATWAAIAYVTAVYAKRPDLLGNAYFEAAAGCVAGMASKMAGDLVTDGTTDAWDKYAGKCLSTGASFYGLTEAATWIKGDDTQTLWMAKQIAKGARWTYDGVATATSALSTKLGRLWTYILEHATNPRVRAGGLRSRA